MSCLSSALSLNLCDAMSQLNKHTLRQDVCHCYPKANTNQIVPAEAQEMETDACL